MKTIAPLLVLPLLLLCARAQEPAAVVAPKIVCPEPNFDFGEKDNTGNVEHDYVLRNEGNLTLEILGVRAACGCTAAKPAENLVPPGGETTVHVNLDLRGRNGMQIKTITVQSNDPQTPLLNLQIRGTAVQGLRAQPTVLFFGRILPGDSRTRPFEVVSGRGPAKIVDARTDHPGVSVAARVAAPDADGSRHMFDVVLADSLPQGTLNTRVVVLAEVNGQPHQLEIPVAALIDAAPAP